MINRNNGHQNADAFMLMWYACNGKSPFGSDRRDVGPCGHTERIWNSRDGVTPFGTTCPSCGSGMVHVAWDQDVYAPDHKLNPWQKYWINVTEEIATTWARQTIVTAKANGFAPPKLEDLVRHHMSRPDQPTMAVHDPLAKYGRPVYDSFQDMWTIMEGVGYNYGEDALTNVEFGWRLARGEYPPNVRAFLDKEETK